MVRAWYLDQKGTNLRDDCQGSSPTFVDVEELQRKTGVLYWQVVVLVPNIITCEMKVLLLQRNFDEKVQMYL